jgi:Tol biopolymer transport system component
MPYKLHPNTKSALWVIFATLIAVIALVVVMNMGTPSASSELPVETLVFMRDDGNDMEIFTINSDGTGERQLTDNEYTDWGPLWSHDHSYIAFHSDRDGYDAIYVMSMLCDDQSYRVTPEGRYARYPSFSPDGTQIAFEMYMGNDNWDIHILSLLDGSIRQVTFNEQIDGGASFSPDGTQLAYHSTQNGYYDIYLMNLDGTGTQRLTFEPETMDVWPEWSPNGDSIIFHSERDGDSEIFVMDANGSNQTNLTNNDELERTPRYSADGTHIVFRAERDGISNIYIMEADGSNIQPVTDSVLSDWYPDF